MKKGSCRLVECVCEGPPAVRERVKVYLKLSVWARANTHEHRVFVDPYHERFSTSVETSAVPVQKCLFGTAQLLGFQH